jgi:polyphosphate:AMP phosphotransferase
MHWRQECVILAESTTQKLGENMFEAAELGRKLSKEEFGAAAPALRAEMLELQVKLREADFPVIVVFAGVDGAGKNESVNLLNEWLDPRWVVTRAYDKPSDEERERPEYWRYWRDLPPKGRFGLFLSSWYHNPLVERAFGDISQAEMDEKLDRIVRFEKTLADDGALIVKFWMHLSKKAQKKRLTKLEKDPLTKWRVGPDDWKHWKQYDHFIEAGEHTIMRTSKGYAQWNIVEGEDARYRSMVVLTTIRDAVNRQIEARALLKETTAAQKKAKKAKPEKKTVLANQPSILSSLDNTLKLDPKEAGLLLQEHRGRLSQLHRKIKENGLTVLAVFEGSDAAGKGGAIRRLTSALFARDTQVVPFAAPSSEERAQHYLWRFWRYLSREGKVTVFDRSWYGRVLVERVEGFCSEDEWRRAYDEINDFEEQLVDHGIVLVKFWLNITKDEQLKRFNDRENIDYKRWKLTEEDWRNREKWEEYEQAVNEMVERTSTMTAPWTLVEANDKSYARVKVISTVCDALEAAVKKRSK